MSCHGIIDCADHWQALLAGIVGFAAAIWAVRITLQSESRKSKRELEALKRALGAEIRQFADQAYRTHLSCMALTVGPGNFHIRQIEEAGAFPDPVVYPNSADRLGLLGNEAHQVVFFFGQIQIFRDAVVRLRRQLGSASIAPMEARGATEILLKVCEVAVGLQPILRSGKFYDKRDAKFGKKVAEAREIWGEPNT